MRARSRASATRRQVVDEVICAALDLVLQLAHEPDAREGCCRRSLARAVVEARCVCMTAMNVERTEAAHTSPKAVLTNRRLGPPRARRSRHLESLFIDPRQESVHTKTSRDDEGRVSITASGSGRAPRVAGLRGLRFLVSCEIRASILVIVMGVLTAAANVGAQEAANVTCKDWLDVEGGKGACSHHRGRRQGGRAGARAERGASASQRQRHPAGRHAARARTQPLGAAAAGHAREAHREVQGRLALLQHSPASRRVLASRRGRAVARRLVSQTNNCNEGRNERQTSALANCARVR